MPLQIGAPDVAFPRLNAFAFWLFLFGSTIAVAGFLTPQGAAAFGWFAYQPLANASFSPGVGGNLWMLGLGMSGFGTILGAVNFVTTIITMRAPGMTMWRMPIFSWNTLVTSILVLMAFPVLAAAILAAAADRVLGAHIYDPANGGVLLWQHLFWFFGHPEVYIIALPFFGIISEILPVFSRKPIFGYKTLVYATIAIAALSVAVWAHHMYVTGAVLLPFFALMTMLIAVPTGVKIFNWIGTMWRGSVTFETPMMFALGFLVSFVFGGLTGVILASPPLDFPLSDSYFVVAHFHYVVFGTVVFAMFAGFYFWWPKWTGKMLNERLGHGALLDAVHRLPHDLPDPALAGCGRHGASLRGLLRRRRLDVGEPGVDHRRHDPRRIDDPVPVQRVDHRPQGAAGDRERPVGLRRVARMGDVVPAAATQLHVDPAHPQRAPRVRSQPPRSRHPGRGRAREGRAGRPGRGRRDGRGRSRCAPTPASGGCCRRSSC